MLDVCYASVWYAASRRMPTVALALIPRAVAINLALGAIAGALRLPVYLDSVGTILVAALAGAAPAVITGVVSNSVLGLLFSPTLFAFVPVTVVIALLAAAAARLGAFRSMAGAAVAGVVIGAAAALASVPIVVALFGGLTASGTGIVTLVLRSGLGLSLEHAAQVASLATDVVDKPISCILVALVISRLPLRLTPRFRMRGP